MTMIFDHLPKTSQLYGQWINGHIDHDHMPKMWGYTTKNIMVIKIWSLAIF